MIRLWEFLIHGCWHDWVVLKGATLVSSVDAKPCGARFYYKCSKCHRGKKQDVT